MVAGDGRHGQAGHRVVQSLDVFVRAEEAHLSLAVFVGFHPLEALDAIVQPGGSRGEGEVLEGNDFGFVPASVHIPVDLQHVVGEGLAELQVLVRSLWLREGEGIRATAGFKGEEISSP